MGFIRFTGGNFVFGQDSSSIVFSSLISSTRTMNTTSPLLGGGTLDSNLTLTIAQANASTNGYLLSTDWNIFNNKQSAGTYLTSISTVSPLATSGGTTPSISIANQSVNTILAGPSTGSPAAPTFRALISSDIPTLGSTTINNGHITSTQTTSPTATTGGATGVGGSSSVSHATDTAGIITLNSGTGILASGAYAVITFNSAYSVAPIVILQPASLSAGLSNYFVTTTTTNFSVNFSTALSLNTTYIFNYLVIQTQ